MIICTDETFKSKPDLCLGHPRVSMRLEIHIRLRLMTKLQRPDALTLSS
jgi:hypothetical protein